MKPHSAFKAFTLDSRKRAARIKTAAAFGRRTFVEQSLTFIHTIFANENIPFIVGRE
uniref:Uncharacterized protein n=1 Tax=Romanomermis culicivorax TaxID=13658 RepID=A0A915KHT4_ROMCU